MHVNDLLKVAVENGASDLHLKVGTYPMMRVRGTLVPAAEDKRLDPEDMVAMAAAVLPTVAGRLGWRPALLLAAAVAIGRVVVVAVGMASSGIPWSWAATGDRAGVNLLPAWPGAARDVVDPLRQGRRDGDVVVISLHWGTNWGHEITRQQRALAHALIDGGVDVVFGHSSHHPRLIEVHRGRLILYGCGDLINDYEGISGHEEHRGDLRLLYLASIRADTGVLAALRMVPLRARRLRLERASTRDTRWLGATLDLVSRPFGSRITVTSGDELELEWDGGRRAGVARSS